MATTSTVQPHEGTQSRFRPRCLSPALWRRPCSRSPHPVQPCSDTQFRHCANACGESHAGLHHRHRRRRHDAGDRHRRHRSVGGLAHGNRWCAVADVLHRAIDPHSKSLHRHRPGDCHPDPDRWNLRPVQRLAHHQVLDPADHRHAGAVHRRPRHRPGFDQRRSPGVQGAGVSGHRHRPGAGCAVPGVDHAGHRRRRGLHPAPHGVRAAGAGGGRQ